MRAIKAKALQKAGRVKLPEAEYYKLRALIRDVEAVELDAMKAAQEFGRQRAAAVQRCRAAFAEIAKAHGFDPIQPWGWDDATCELVAKAKPNV